MKPSAVRACGAVIAFGALAWSFGWLQAGVLPVGPDGNSINNQVEIWASGVFQLGFLALLIVMKATQATGASRAGRWILNGEFVLLALAIAWTIPFLFDANRPHNTILSILDAFWPLSMVGLIAVGIMVVVARRWPSPARFLPLAASLLIPVDIILSLAGIDPWAAIVIRSAYLTVAYGLLGVAVASQVAPLARPRARGVSVAGV